MRLGALFIIFRKKEANSSPSFFGGGRKFQKENPKVKFSYQKMREI